ncbi:MAG: hypothetical protein ACK5AZ_16425 [Bryobacteraceae bacterium]
MTYWILIVATFGYFLWHSYRKRTTSSAEHEGRPSSVNVLQLYMTLLATAIGGGLIFALIQFGQVAGTIGLLLGFVYCLSFIALGCLAPSIRRVCRVQSTCVGNCQSVSVVQLLSARYKETWGIILVAYLIAYIGFLAAQFVAMAELVQNLNAPLSATALIFVSGVFVLACVGLAGFKSVLATDVGQVVIIAVILVLSVLAVFFEGVINFSHLPTDYWNPFANVNRISLFVWLSVFLFPTLLLRPDHWQRIIAAKDDRTAKLAYGLAGGTLFAVFAVLVAVGASATVAGSSSPFYLFNQHFRGAGGFGGELLFAGILVAFLCAVVSSADTILNTAASATVQTLRNHNHCKGDGVKCILSSYVGITALAMAAALRSPDVVSLITDGFQAMIILLPAIAAGMLKKIPSNMAAKLSVLGGLIGWGVLYFLTAASSWGYIVGFFAALLILLFVYKIESIQNASQNST